MNRQNEIEECKDIITSNSTNHLHIRKKAIVGDFENTLRNSLETDFNVISIDIARWSYDEIMTTLRWELQKELSTLQYSLSRIKSLGASALGFSVNVGVEAKPEYSRINRYIDEIAEKAQSHAVVIVDYHGDQSADDFGWISKLDEIPANFTIISYGYQKCTREQSQEFEVGRLSSEQTHRFLSSELSQVDRETAEEVRRIHDGNPVAIRLALENDSLIEPLSGETLEKLWNELYEQNLSADETDLLYESAHLVDLAARDVALSVEKKLGETKEILSSLENKGIVSQKKAGLFTTDWYVKEYITNQLSKSELQKNHQRAFQNYAEKWIDNFEAVMEDVDGDEPDDFLSLEQTGQGLSNPDLFFAIYHLSESHSSITEDNFVSELENIDADGSGIFMFGLQAQRFFFEEPIEIIQKLAEELLDLDSEVNTDFFSGTIGILMDFDPEVFLTELAQGWSGGVRTSELATGTASQPDEIAKKIQHGIGSNFYENAPVDVKMAIARFLTMPYADTRTAQDYYNLFGKTAMNYGLEEEPFTNWLHELLGLLDKLEPELDSTPDEDDSPDQIEEHYERLDRDIRDRVELQALLEQNRSEAQQQFQQKLENIREHPSEVTEQYVTCGKELAETENPLFPYMWFLMGDEVFAKAILGGFNKRIYGKHMEWLGRRKEFESDHDSEEIIVFADDIEGNFESFGD